MRQRAVDERDVGTVRTIEKVPGPAAGVRCDEHEAGSVREWQERANANLRRLPSAMQHEHERRRRIRIVRWGDIEYSIAAIRDA